MQASSFTTNGSAARWLRLKDPQRNIAVTVHSYIYDRNDKGSPTVLRHACMDLVAWARLKGVKVHIGEIAIDAGPNLRGTYCSTFATATAQWTDWNNFCVANNDVLLGWNWWANSAPAWWNQGDSCDPAGFHWG